MTLEPTTTDIQTPRYLTEREASALLGISMKTLQNWRWRGMKPRFIKMHGCVRYSVEDLLEFVGECRQ